MYRQSAGNLAWQAWLMFGWVPSLVVGSCNIYVAHKEILYRMCLVPCNEDAVLNASTIGVITISGGMAK